MIALLKIHSVFTYAEFSLFKYDIQCIIYLFFDIFNIT